MSKQDGKIIEPRNDALKLDALDQKHGHGRLVLSQEVQKGVLQVLRTRPLFGLRRLGSWPRRECSFAGHILSRFLAARLRTAIWAPTTPGVSASSSRTNLMWLNTHNNATQS